MIWKKKSEIGLSKIIIYLWNNVVLLLAKTSKEKPMLLSKFAVYDYKKLSFIKEQCELLSNLWLKTPLSKFLYWVIFLI